MGSIKMSRPLVKTVNLATSEEIVREMNDAEFAEWQSEATARDERQAKSVRQIRDNKLKECDWRAIKALESNIPQEFEWAAYRQALRDVPTQAGFPWSVTWPNEP